MIKILTILCVGVLVGWVSNGVYKDMQELTCSDYSTKHAVWKGFLSTKGGDMRCFWLEDKFPWRVRQGVPVQ